MPQVRAWEAKQPGDWFVRHEAEPVYTVQIPCGHDGNLRRFTVTVDAGELTVEEPITCPQHPTPRWRLRAGQWETE